MLLVEHKHMEKCHLDYRSAGLLQLGPLGRSGIYRTHLLRLLCCREVHFFVESVELRRGDPDIADADLCCSGLPHFEAAPIGCAGTSPDASPIPVPATGRSESRPEA